MSGGQHVGDVVCGEVGMGRGTGRGGCDHCRCEARPLGRLIAQSIGRSPLRA